MPRRFDSISRYLHSSSFNRTPSEPGRSADGKDLKIEPLVGYPDYSSIVRLASKLNIYGKDHPPPTSLKGVFFIDQGATFSVYRATYHSRSYAIKQPRLVFQYGQDENETMRQLYSLHLELRVLTDPNIRSHGNIASLEMIQWGEHPDDHGRYWPSLVMEYADHGTLSACYERGIKFTADDEKRLCFGIGDALSFLHQNGVIHGDIKPQNVLMFNGSKPGAFVPKLSDFGFSVLDKEVPNRHVGGTPDWEAPELLDALGLSKSSEQSDVYSFGLLLWYIARDGRAPFAGCIEAPILPGREGARGMIRSLKKNHDIARIASNSLSPDKSFYLGVFDRTLTREPQDRDLKSTLSCLDVDKSMRDQSSTLTRLPAQTDQFNIREFRHLGRRVQRQIIDSFKVKSADTSSDNAQRSEAAMNLAIICLECFDGKTPEEALEWLEHASNLGNALAKSVFYRVSKALHRYDEKKHILLRHLLASAEDGIQMSVDDLIEADEKQGKAVLCALKEKRRQQCLSNLSISASQSQLTDFSDVLHSVDDNILHRAARCGDESLILNNVKRHELLNSQNKLGQTPLLLACIAGEVVAAEALLNAGASAAIADTLGDTPLHWLSAFAIRSIPLIAARLIESGADVHAYSSRHERDEFSQKHLAAGTPLHRAAGWNSGEAVRVLLGYGADPIRPNRGGTWHESSTPLWLACSFHNSEAVRVILDHLSKTPDLAAILDGGQSKAWPYLKPVLDLNYYYLFGGMLGRITRHAELYSQATADTIRALKDHGASMFFQSTVRKPNAPGHPALSSAVLLRCADIVEAMLEIAPETIEKWDPKHRQPPLHFAVQQDRIDIVKALLSRGAQLCARNAEGITALANYANYNSDVEMSKFLLNRGLRYEIPSNGFVTPFFGAMARGSFELAAFVLQQTPPEDRNKMINTPGHKAVTFKDATPPGLTILGYLVEDFHQNASRAVRRLFDIVQQVGESVDFIVYPGEKKTALHVLAQRRAGARIDPVIDAMAMEIVNRCEVTDINLVSGEGKTALWEAVRTLNYGLADLILEKGGDPTIADGDGVSSMDILRTQVVHVREQHRDAENQNLVESFLRLFKSHGYSLDLDT